MISKTNRHIDTHNTDASTALESGRVEFNVDDLDYYIARSKRMRAKAVADMSRTARRHIFRAITQAFAPLTSPLGPRLNRREKSTVTEAQAIAELQRSSDAELADLGIRREMITQVVRHGRTGFPEEHTPSTV